MPDLRRWKLAAWIAAGVLALAVLLLAAATAIVWPQLPGLDPILDYHPRQPLEILTRDGQPLAQYGPERRRFVPIAETPKLLQDALLATEDAGFRDHIGISLKGIARATLANLVHARSQGASTITQQVARNFFLSRRKSYVRKFSEILLALKIERALSKDQILELYMNQIYLGQHAYGFEAAALTYYGKPAAQLSIAQTAMLAGLPQNPVYANPFAHADHARARQLWVLRRMHDTGAIDDRQYAAAQAEPAALASRHGPALRGDHLAEMVRRLVVERFGEQAYSDGLKVTTSVLAADQQAAVEALRKGVLDFDRRQPWRGPEDEEDLLDDDLDIERLAAQALREHPDDDELRVAIVLHASPQQVTLQRASGETRHLAGEALRLAQPGLLPGAPEALAVERGAIVRVQRLHPEATTPPEWRIAQWPDTQAALVALDTRTGQLRALVGGFDFAHSQFNHALDAWRQPGSSFKPFLYSAALEQGVMPATIINDAPLEFDATAGGGSHWEPRNSDGQFDGPITLRQALARSKNLVSIRLVQMMGVGTAREWAGRFGFAPDKHPDNLTLALGAGSATPIQMARAYAMLDNGGFAITPRFIERITDARGKVLFEAPPPPPLAEEQRVVPARNAFVVDSLLQEVARSGTAARAQAQLKRPDLYGKTGTTNDAVDAWFAGFQPEVAAVVWMGKDEPQSLGARESGGGLALPIWIDYMRTALRATAVAEISPPAGVQMKDGDWVFDDYADGGEVSSLGVEPGSPPVVVRAARAASAPAASSAEAGASPPGLPASASALAQAAVASSGAR